MWLGFRTDRVEYGGYMKVQTTGAVRAYVVRPAEWNSIRLAQCAPR